MGAVRELRVALTVEDFDAALHFYRDILGLDEREAWSEDGRVVILEAGRATLELLDDRHAAVVDGIETGRREPTPIRLALEVADSAATADALEAAGAERLGGPVVTPWSHRNVRMRAPEGTQLTLFSVLE
jgi:lactoylglutathione lyase